MNTQIAAESNRLLWEEWTQINSRSSMYNLEGFRNGARSLHDLEIREMGDVSGKTLLHLQCHFGLDTLSWADRGAIVTGVDLSHSAIELAKRLSDELSIPARFIEADIMQFEGQLSEQFDIVYTSYGALNWLPDIRKWARTVSSYLKPGGVFYMAEIHPVSFGLDDGQDQEDLIVKYPYFCGPEPMEFDVQGSYSDPDAVVTITKEYAWQHSLGDIITAIAENGMRIQFLHEHDETVFQQGKWLEKNGERMYRMKQHNPSFPLIYSVKAVRETL